MYSRPSGLGEIAPSLTTMLPGESISAYSDMGGYAAGAPTSLIGADDDDDDDEKTGYR